jgi:hypothetical protein
LKLVLELKWRDIELELVVGGVIFYHDGVRTFVENIALSIEDRNFAE